MKHKKSRLSYANVTSTLALALVVGGGTAYAAGLVGTDDLARGAVTAPKIAKNAVTGPKVENGSLGLADLGGKRPFSRVVTRSSTVSFTGEPAGSFKEQTTVCEEGEALVSGGHHVSALDTTIPISRPATADGASPPEGKPTQGWHVLARQGTDGAYATVTVYAVCAS